MAIVELENVRKVYTLGKTEVHALRGVSFSIEKGDFASIVGPSGSGKSTILNLIGCIDQPTAGTVSINGLLQKAQRSALNDLRHKTVDSSFNPSTLFPS